MEPAEENAKWKRIAVSAIALSRGVDKTEVTDISVDGDLDDLLVGRSVCHDDAHHLREIFGRPGEDTAHYNRGDRSANIDRAITAIRQVADGTNPHGVIIQLKITTLGNDGHSVSLVVMPPTKDTEEARIDILEGFASSVDRMDGKFKYSVCTNAWNLMAATQVSFVNRKIGFAIEALERLKSEDTEAIKTVFSGSSEALTRFASLTGEISPEHPLRVEVYIRSLGTREQIETRRDTAFEFARNWINTIETRFINRWGIDRVKLGQLQDMGFIRIACIKALKATNNNVPAAIDRLAPG